MYGNVNSRKQSEKTSFHPVSPYAISKLYAHWMVNLYRDAYGIFCCSGILFNHESPLRGREFVTKKIVTDLVKVKFGQLPCLKLGNIYARRDWGYSMDYVEAMWRMMQQKKSDDYVISSGITHTIKTFIIKTAKNLDMHLKWEGEGLGEKAIDLKTKKIVVKIDKKYFRPTDVNVLYGDSSKAKKILKWKPSTNLNELIKIMCEYEVAKYK